MSVPQWTGVLIHGNFYGMSPMSNREDFMRHLSFCVVDFDHDGSVTRQSLRDLLGNAGSTCIGNAYDRDPRIDDWYYSFYANTANLYGEPNHIANIITPSNHPPIRGPVLAVLNGPEDGMWEVTEKIDAVKLGQTLWWYFKSGNDPRDVFGERELRRYIRTMVK